MTRRTRRLLLLTLPAALVASAIAVWLLWPRPSAMTRENAERIQVGMTLAEVEEILGGPPRQESDWPQPEWAQPIAASLDPDRNLVVREWKGAGCCVTVAFDLDQHVVRGGVGVGIPWFPEETPLATLRRWLGL